MFTTYSIDAYETQKIGYSSIALTFGLLGLFAVCHTESDLSPELIPTLTKIKQAVASITDVNGQPVSAGHITYIDRTVLGLPQVMQDGRSNEIIVTGP